MVKKLNVDFGDKLLWDSATVLSLKIGGLARILTPSDVFLAAASLSSNGSPDVDHADVSKWLEEAHGFIDKLIGETVAFQEARGGRAWPQQS